MTEIPVTITGAGVATVDLESVKGDKGDPGEQGPQGEQGFTGIPGPQGIPGPAQTPDAVRQIIREYLVDANGAPLAQNTAGKLVIPGATPPPIEPPPAGGDPVVTTAAARFGWGTPNRVDTFTQKPSAATGWTVYGGAGHAGNGTRSPNAVSVNNGIMSIVGDAAGQSAGMAWRVPGAMGQYRGRWEVCMKTVAGSVNYHPVMLLWNDAQQWPASEVDFVEILDSASRQKTYYFLHWAQNGQLDPPNQSTPDVGSVTIDATQWHAWAVEWTPTYIACYVDGVEWARSTAVHKMPPSAMHLCLQLDNFSNRGSIAAGGRMDFAWAKQYSL